MRILFILFLLISTENVWCQSKDGVIKVRKKENQLPKIAGVAGGEIDATLLCSGEGIEINKNIKVTSFVLFVESGGKEVSMKQSGNKLNKDACAIIALLKSGAEIYINEIAVVDQEGRESITTPMRLTIK